MSAIDSSELDDTKSLGVWLAIQKRVCAAEEALDRSFEGIPLPAEFVAAIRQEVDSSDSDPERSVLLIALISKALQLFDAPREAKALLDNLASLKEYFPKDSAVIDGILQLYAISHPNTWTPLPGIEPLPPPICIPGINEPKHNGIPFGYTVIGPQKAGGMGVVYHAIHDKSEREVALKQIKPNRFAPGRTALFEREFRAGSRLRHPNIAAIHDVGMCEGIPYFTMDWIDGGNLGQQLNGGPLKAERVARIGKKVADALQYAHQRGVRHRDLKPANILMDEDDEPVICDFGLATIVSDDGVLPHEPGIIGTPEYMAPEQACGLALDKTGCQKSDIFSLGATLYEIVIGAPPYTGERTVVIEKAEKCEFVRASMLVNSRLNPDLAAIIDKCMDADPDCRYNSAQDVADELNRFLEKRPVLARPLPPPQRLLRWIANNRVAAGVIASAGVMIFIMALLGRSQSIATADASASAEAASAARVRAEISASHEQTARIDAEKHLRDAIVNATAADTNSNRARIAVNRFVELATSNQVLKDERFRPLREQMLRDALEYNKSFIELNKDNQRARHDLAIAFFDLGRINGSSGSPDDARTAYQNATLVYQELIDKEPTVVKHRQSLAGVWSNLGNVNLELGDHRAARLCFHEARERQRVLIQEALLQKEPAVDIYRRNLAGTLHSLARLECNLGDVDKALLTLAEAIELQRSLVKTHSDVPAFAGHLVKSLHESGALLAHHNRSKEADQYFVEAQSICKDLTTKRPEVTEYRSDLAKIVGGRGNLSWQLGEGGDAERHWKSALDLQETLAKENPFDWDCQRDLAVNHNNLGNVKQRSGQLQAALAHYVGAHQIRQSLIQRQPQVVLYWSDFAMSCNNLGAFYYAAGNLKEARTMYLKAKEVQESLVAKQGSVVQYRSELAQTLNNIGNLEVDNKNLDIALSHYNESLDIRRQLVASHPKVLEYRLDLAAVLGNLARLQIDKKNTELAWAHFDEELVIRQQLHDKNPQVMEFVVELAQSFNNYGVALLRDEEPRKALEKLQRAEILRKQATTKLTRSPRLHSDLGKTYALLADAWEVLNEHQKSVELLEQAIDKQQQATKMAPEELEFRRRLNTYYGQLARVQRTMLRPTQAVETTLKRKDLWPNVPQHFVEVARDIALCIPLLTAKQVNFKGDVDSESNMYVELALSALKEAKSAGFSEFSQLKQDEAFSPLTAR